MPIPIPSVKDIKELFSEIIKDRPLRFLLILATSGAVGWFLIVLIITLVDAKNGKPVDFMGWKKNQPVARVDTLRLPAKVDTINSTKTIYLDKPAQKEKPPTISQKIGPNAKGFQNNAPNYGNQAMGDINVREKELTPLEIDSALQDIDRLMKQGNFNCISLLITTQSNGQKVYTQLMGAIRTKMPNCPLSTGQSYTSPGSDIKKIVVMKYGDCLGITVGRFD